MPGFDPNERRSPSEWQLSSLCTEIVTDYAGWTAEGLSVGEPITFLEFERLAALSGRRPRHPEIRPGVRTIPVPVVSLRSLRVGAIFIGQDAWDNGRTLYVKLRNYGFSPGDNSCFIGSVNGSQPAPKRDTVRVQEVDIAPDVAFHLRLAAGMTAIEARKCEL